MGKEKAWLPVGAEVMLQRVVRIVAETCQPIVVVARKGQSLPELPRSVVVVRDSQPERGPLQGLHDGLAAISADSEPAFVTGCDAPLLTPSVIQHIANRLDDREIAVPVHEGLPQALMAAYHISVHAQVADLLASGQRSLRSLLKVCDTLEISTETLRRVDPQLRCLLNCNRPEDYQAVLHLLEQET